MKDIAIRDMKKIVKQQQEENYYKPKRVSNFWNNNYFQFESNCNRNKSLSPGEYINKTEPYLRDITIDRQKSDTQKIHLTIAINFIFS